MFFYLRLAAIYYIKAGHHARSMVFDDMAVIHPRPGTVVRDPGYLDFVFWFQIVRILPRFVFRGLTVFFNDLKKEAMQVKRVVHPADIVDLPDLQFANFDRCIRSMYLTINFKVQTLFP